VAIQAMTDLAVMLKVFRSELEAGSIIWYGIAPVLAADNQILALLNNLLFYRTWRTCLTTDQK
jgi:hypothetical protein